MTKTEYNEFRYIAKTLRQLPPTYGCTCTIRTNASESLKTRLDALYASYNMHPAGIRIDPQFYDDHELFRRLGGSETVRYQYCPAGYLPQTVTSISPDGQTKIIRSFAFKAR